MTTVDWLLILLGVATVGFVVLLGLLVLFDWLGIFGRDDWD